MGVAKEPTRPGPVLTRPWWVRGGGAGELEAQSDLLHVLKSLFSLWKAQILKQMFPVTWPGGWGGGGYLDPPSGEQWE